MRYNNVSKPVTIGFVFFMVLIFPQSVCFSGQAPVRPASLSTARGASAYIKDLPGVKSVKEWPNSYGDGITIRTPHYVINTTMLDPLMLRQIPSFMESAYAQYNKQLPKPIKTHTPFIIYLFADRSQWEAFTRQFTGEHASNYLAIKKGAYYLNGACVAYNIGRTKTFSVLGHEGWHQFNSKHFAYRLPSWLDEGIATLFEATHSKNGGFYFNPAHNMIRLGALKQAVTSNKLKPLKEIIMLSPGQVVHKDIEDVTLFYAQSYALARFLREDQYGKRLRKYHNMLLGAVDGTWPLDEELAKIASDRNIPLTVTWNSFISPRLFDYYIAENMDQLDREYKAFCYKAVYHIKMKR